MVFALQTIEAKYNGAHLTISILIGNFTCARYLASPLYNFHRDSCRPARRRLFELYQQALLHHTGFCLRPRSYESGDVEVSCMRELDVMGHILSCPLPNRPSWQSSQIVSILPWRIYMPHTQS